MSKNRIFNLVDLIINLLIFGFTVFSVVSYFIFGGVGNMSVIGFYTFKYFTVDSNVLVAIGSGIIIYFNIKNLINDTNKLPLWAEITKFIGVCGVTIAMLTVILFLGPTLGWGIMYLGVNALMHLVTPLLALLSFVFLERRKLNINLALTSMAPVVIYGSVYLINVLITQVWEDFYGFNRDGLWAVSIVIMILSSYVLGILLFLSGKATQKIPLFKIEE